MRPISPPAEGQVYAFDGFTLDPHRRSLSVGSVQVALGSRALDLLIALVERAGEVLSRDHLVARVWPRTIVEDSSLRVHVAALRKALEGGSGERRSITNVPGRGYSFVGHVSLQSRTVPGRQADIDPPVLPQLLSRLVGRDPVLATLGTMLQRCHVVCIAGPGGVGKTSVAQHVLARNASRFADGAAWVDLAQPHPAGVVAQVAAALNLPDTDLAGLASALQQRSLLLALDNCEHVLDAIAPLAEAITSRAPSVRLLCTSREPLNVAGEHVLRLEPLANAPAAAVTLQEARQAPAIDLFVERARAAADTVMFDDDDVPDLRALCRQLDGLPLALELAALRVPVVGVRGLLTRPDDLLQFLTRGRRAAQPRHHSLRAAIDWSYDMLDAAERRVLCCVAVFASPFSLTSAAAVVEMPRAGGGIEEVVLRLADKSLLLPVRQADDSDDGTCYRLLHATRSYALERLRELPDAEAVQARHRREVQRLADRAQAALGVDSAAA
jgi:predicted ATPase/DNA-binding winged helix-turn-helix (wHTH) protein